ncbi:hypothetical protein [Bradyrhizobium sp. ARR65]|uniref:hypothetical protein n=1 Tax=Bradyrhizobium sp. ARR65 TaxID=1040989 RepID=UPI000ACA67AE|nr:hypothetical protein [Bradyrhizobium sp. ARR65]
MRDDVMPFSEHSDPLAICDRLRNATIVTPGLMMEIVEAACRRLPAGRQTTNPARIRGLIDAHAWTDAALALVDLELPSWRIRRIAYDAGDWYCALSRQRELPDWLDQSIESRHADLAIAILSALVEAQITEKQPSGPGVPAALRNMSSDHISLCCENFA